MSRKVVIADDSPTLRRIVTSVLAREGYEVIAVEDGVQAVQAAFREQPDAVILDVQMPRVSGYVAARLLKDDWQSADLPILLLTSLDAASDRYWGAQTGADRYLTKDFEAPELVAAVDELLARAAAGRGGRPPLRPEPSELSDDDVLSRVCDLLDRKLFETSVAGEVIALSARVRGFEATVASLLGLLRGFVDYELGSVLLFEERTAYVAVAGEATQAHYNEFLTAAADALGSAAGAEFAVDGLDVRLADPEHRLGAREDDDFDDSGRMSTFLSMLLRGHGGQVLGVLALSSSVKNAFGETALSTLQLVESPAAVVIDNARLAGARTG